MDLADLHKDLTSLKGVGPKTAEFFAKLSIYTPWDLLFYLPVRYEDKTKIHPISSALAGQSYLLEGTIINTKLISAKKPLLNVLIEDYSGNISLKYFNYAYKIKDKFIVGETIRVFGEIKQDNRGLRYIAHPEFRIIPKGEQIPLADKLNPIYGSTKGLSQSSIRKAITSSLQILKSSLNTNFESELLILMKEYTSSNFYDSLLNIHFPDVKENLLEILSGVSKYHKRLALEELLAIFIGLKVLRKKTNNAKGYKLDANNSLAIDLLNNLPFKLTSAQERVLSEIKQDLSTGKPMLRLVQGDVGSGKTIVAALAVLAAVNSQGQAVVMAPTELLAEQHCNNFKKWFEPLGIKVQTLTGKLRSREKRNVIENIALGIAQVVVGTHALFQEGVDYKDLRLVVIDEQHRFGVVQRLSLKNKGLNPENEAHQLIMTATPIPRSLAMTMYSDLDISVIDELPPGRQVINTVAVSQVKRDSVLDRVKSLILEGRQVYWVCTLIDESETIESETALETFQLISNSLKGVKVGLIHGRMSALEKESTMSLFNRGEIKVLVATTVIEVGVDVPNATLMVIENPERLGLAQLHQLRGRVGRGSEQSYCVLLYKNPLSKNAKERIEVMRSTSDGFVIADKDLELRGPGEVLGTRQTGDISFKIADLNRDKILLQKVVELAKLIFNNNDLVSNLSRKWLLRDSEYAKV